jgi:hypothetical protein
LIVARTPERESAGARKDYNQTDQHAAEDDGELLSHEFLLKELPLRE